MTNLGKKAMDKITGFEGIITGKVTYLYGCNQYLLVPKAKDGEIKDGNWFDEGRVTMIGEGVKAQDVIAEKPGPDISPNRKY